jgi:hypothetical protein
VLRVTSVERGTYQTIRRLRMGQLNEHRVALADAAINIAGLLKIWDFGTFLCLIADAIRSPGRLKRIGRPLSARFSTTWGGARYGLEFRFDVPLDTAATTTGLRYHGPLEHGRADQRKCADKTDARPIKWWQTVAIDYE